MKVTKAKLNLTQQSIKQREGQPSGEQELHGAFKHTRTFIISQLAKRKISSFHLTVKILSKRKILNK